jgi:hypothetical protein
MRQGPMNPSDQEAWLGEHIPHRLRAGLTGLQLQRELLTAIADANAPRNRLQSAGENVLEVITVKGQRAFGV